MAQQTTSGLHEATKAPFWVGAPVIRILLPFMAGIVLAWYLQPPFAVLIGAGIVVLAAWLLAYRLAYYSPAAFGLANNLLWIALGASLQVAQNPARSPNYIWQQYVPGTLLMATLEEEPVPKRKSYKAIAQLRQWDSAGNRWQALQGKVILYFPKNNPAALPAQGAAVVFNKNLQPLTNTGNPGAFNYQAYAAHKQWYAQVFLQPADFAIAPLPLQFGFARWLTRLRNGLLHTLNTNISTPDDFGMAAALLTGYREALDEEISLAYAATGTAHIIAISGLHLGLIQKALMLLFAPLLRFKSGLILRGLTVITLLWVFALLTGAGASVLRAAIMFTLLTAGEMMEERVSSLNLLAIAAFLLLSWDTDLLWDVGFQLSFAAVFSIIFLYRPIYGWIPVKNFAGKFVWSITAVTLAAQVFTLPLVLYYFNQFPVYFLLANLVAVPLSTGILYLLVLLGVGFFWWPQAAALLGLGAQYLIKAMNWFVLWINKLPFSRVEGLYITLAEAALLTLVLGGLCLWLKQRRPAYAIAGAACLGLLLLSLQYRQALNAKAQSLVVYHVPGHSAIDLQAAGNACFVGSDTCNRPGMLRKLNLYGARLQMGMPQQLPACTPVVDSGAVILSLAGKKALLIQHAGAVNLMSPPADTLDWVIVAAPLKQQPLPLMQQIPAREWIIDGKMPRSRLSQWQIAADSLHLQLHAVAQKGAYVYRVIP